MDEKRIRVKSRRPAGEVRLPSCLGGRKRVASPYIIRQQGGKHGFQFVGHSGCRRRDAGSLHQRRGGAHFAGSAHPGGAGGQIDPTQIQVTDLAKTIQEIYFDQNRAVLDCSKTLKETLCPEGGDHIPVRSQAHSSKSRYRLKLWKSRTRRPPPDKAFPLHSLSLRYTGRPPHSFPLPIRPSCPGLPQRRYRTHDVALKRQFHCHTGRNNRNRTCTGPENTARTAVPGKLKTQ